SFYNETAGRPIYPTPTVAVVGLLEPWEHFAVSHFLENDLAILLLGEAREELGGSEWLALRRGLEAGPPPRVDLTHEVRLHGLLAEGVRAGVVLSAHDVSSGGLAVALAECSFAGARGVKIGCEVMLQEPQRLDALLFGESTGRVIVTSRDPERLLCLAQERRVPALRVGTTGGSRLRIAPWRGPSWIDAPLERLASIWESALPRRLATDEASGLLPSEVV
ncbi:MAG TPA: AIR synthase-related protein, partial [Myxococcota bacterium]|nr:AIR synthase-related protein [Myxococcota bacterium]